MNSEDSCCSHPQVKGVEHAGVIDMMTHDPKTDVLTIVMIEPRPWDGSELQMFQLQEKLNAYMSFVLDGELAEAYPALVDKPVKIQLDCATPPPDDVIHFLKMVREQISFQGIEFEVHVKGGGCGAGCGCANS